MLMRSGKVLFAKTAIIAAALYANSGLANDDNRGDPDAGIQIGQRPLYLVDVMDDDWLKRKLKSCKAGPFGRSDFSIGPHLLRFIDSGITELDTKLGPILWQPSYSKTMNAISASRT